jgi:L-lactate utilization protein LutB
MANIAVEQTQEIERLKEEIANGPQGTVDRLIEYLDQDLDKRKRNVGLSGQTFFFCNTTREAIIIAK